MLNISIYLDLIPCKIINPEPVKISGHSLNGRKSILKPVKSDKTDMAINMIKVRIYTALITMVSFLQVIVAR